MKKLALVVMAVAAVGIYAPNALAHPHTAGPKDQVLANGQLHDPAFRTTGVACGGDPAAYGLETAHHGPDSGTPGKGADGCYASDSTPPEDENPAID